MELQQFQQHILKGIPSVLPQPKTYESTINHAPKRKDILNGEEKKLAIQNGKIVRDATYYNNCQE
jgi:urocanate hydratase